MYSQTYLSGPVTNSEKVACAASVSDVLPARKLGREKIGAPNFRAGKTPKIPSFAPKKYGNACYAGYRKSSPLFLFTVNLTSIGMIWFRQRFFSGPLRFSRSRLATLSFVKISMCSYERPGWYCDRDLGFSVTGIKIFPYEHSNPGDQDKTFLKK